MKRPATIVILIALCGTLIAFSPAQESAPKTSAGQPKQAAPKSPRAQVETTLGGKKISVDYGRPSMRGRVIMGDLVPYGQVWRTGANEATGFVTETDLDINGTRVPAGKYTLYTLPDKNGWKLIINKETGQWGTPEHYHEAQDLARIDMQKETLPSLVDQFTISLEKKSETEAVMHMDWELTRVSVPLKTTGR